MSVALASIFLAHAAVTCPSTARPPLAGGAVLVRPVGSAETAPFALLEGAPPVAKAEGVRQTVTDRDAPDSTADHEQCPPVAFPIV